MQTLVQLSIDRVRAYMREHDLSRYQLSNLAGVPWQAVKDIMSDDFVITTNHLERLERLVMTQPRPEKVRPGNPWLRKPKAEETSVG
jgi:hypothetical protein